MKRIQAFIAVYMILCTGAIAQSALNSSSIYNELLKLKNTATVMYVAAHPDDENTRLITWLANEKHVNTVYLSLTRGDGGQNLIGTEAGPALGMLRTQELLQARGIDGGKQWFSRAYDFGFSKKAAETFSIWDKPEILKDVVQAIRYWQPDIMINRFPTDTSVNTHGHHTASAILGSEAFDLSAKQDYDIEGAKTLGYWQPTSLYFNTSSFLYKSQADFEKADKSGFSVIEVDNYYPLLGKSNNEISALSRSMHKCQAFGSIGNRGSFKEYLLLLKGTQSPVKDDILAGIDQSWKKFTGNESIDKLIDNIIRDFNFTDPSKSLGKLKELGEMIVKNIPEGRFKDRKLQHLNKIFVSCSGVFTELVCTESTGIPGQVISAKLEITHRTRGILKVNRLNSELLGIDTFFTVSLPSLGSISCPISFQIPPNSQYTSPYWLQEPIVNGAFQVKDRSLIGLPETKKLTGLKAEMELNGIPINFDVPITYKYEDAARGEVYEPFDVLAPVTMSLSEEIVLFTNSKMNDYSVSITANQDGLNGTLMIKANPNWIIENNNQSFMIAKKGQSIDLIFRVKAPEKSETTDVSIIASVDKKNYSYNLSVVKYDHIPTQRIMKPLFVKWVSEEIKCSAKNVAYIMGAGDKVPQSLEKLNINHKIFNKSVPSAQELVQFDVLIIGIRAYNTIPELFNAPSMFKAYMENGGTVIVQYNTNYDLVTNDIAPFPLKITRNRVTNENSPVRILEPNHPIVNFPNKILDQDWNNWIQERGLYFVESSDPSCVKLLGMNDPNEATQDGSLVYASIGKGHFIYTGLSFFRELPAGVPGAWKLWANLLSVGHATK